MKRLRQQGGDAADAADTEDKGGHIKRIKPLPLTEQPGFGIESSSDRRRRLIACPEAIAPLVAPWLQGIKDLAHLVAEFAAWRYDTWKSPPCALAVKECEVRNIWLSWCGKEAMVLVRRKDDQSFQLRGGPLACGYQNMTNILLPETCRWDSLCAMFNSDASLVAFCFSPRSDYGIRRLHVWSVRHGRFVHLAPVDNVTPCWSHTTANELFIVLDYGHVHRLCFVEYPSTGMFEVALSFVYQSQDLICGLFMSLESKRLYVHSVGWGQRAPNETIEVVDPSNGRSLRFWECGLTLDVRLGEGGPDWQTVITSSCLPTAKGPRKLRCHIDTEHDESNPAWVYHDVIPKAFNPSFQHLVVSGNGLVAVQLLKLQ